MESKVVKHIKAESKLVVARGWEEREMGVGSTDLMLMFCPQKEKGNKVNDAGGIFWK